MDKTWFKIMIIGVAMSVGFGSYFITKKPDAPIEQVAEAVLRTQGIDVDLSPE